LLKEDKNVWVKVLKILECEHVSGVKEPLLLAAKYDVLEWVDSATGTPYVQLDEDDVFVVSPEMLWSPVQVIPSLEEDRCYWVNWWCDSGVNKYPFDHYYRVLAEQ